MNRKVLFSLILVVLCFSIISALATPVTVETAPGYKVTVTASDATSSDFLVLDKLRGDADEEGIFAGDLDLTRNFNVYIYISNEGGKVNSEKLEEEYAPGDAITLNYAPGWYVKQKEMEAQMAARANGEAIEVPDEVLEVNDTGEEDPDEVPEAEDTSETDENSEITGLAIDGEDGLSWFSMTYLYWAIAIIIVLIIIFIILKLVKKKPKSSDSGEPMSKLDQEEKNLVAAEQKIKNAEAEIQRLKNNSDKQAKVEAMKKKLEEDRKRLEELEK